MDHLIQKANNILDLNWRDGFTVPRDKLYPFQWNWDSGFVSLGMAHKDLHKAIEEIQSLFSGQWENGMIPHIIFHSENEKTYFPNFDFWNCGVNSGAPTKPKTSGITQPPVIGFVLETLMNRFPDSELLEDFLKDIFPKVVQYHAFLYNYRDPHNEGLFFIYHPWESGRDNSPIWDQSLDRIQIKPGSLPAYTRRDTSIADASERPTSEQYDRYVYLLELGKKHQYDQVGIAEESPFLIQDSMMNAILIKSNDSLIKIANRYGLDHGQLSEWQQQSLRSYDAKMWNDDINLYTGYDLRGGHQIQHKEIGGLVSLYANIPTPERAQIMADDLQSLHDRGYYLCPSFDIDSPLFDSKRYWRGPIWPQMNWMIHHGLHNYGHDDLATIVKSDLIELVQKHGFYEYFESQKAVALKATKGYGGDKFSWTASSIIDLILHK